MMPFLKTYCYGLDKNKYLQKKSEMEIMGDD